MKWPPFRLISTLQTRPARNCLGGRPNAKRLEVEALEERAVPATYTVTTGVDSGPGSLRQAILDANANPGTDTIAFHLGSAGVQTIQPTAALPQITDPVVIDWTTEPGYAGTPLVVVNCSGFNGGSAGYGLWITAGNSTIRGLVINGVTGADIRIEGGGNNLVVGNYLGTDATGSVAVAGNANSSNVGLLILSGNNTVGGTTAPARNLISGHNSYGVYLSGGAASGNVVRGNYIGTDAAGTAALANYFGVGLNGAPSNLIGGTISGAGNIVSGNTIVGVGLIDATGNQVQGNLIGTDVTGSHSLGNRIGVYVAGGSSDLIGGTQSGAGNIISGNNGSAPNFGWGVIFTTDSNNAPADEDQVLGNYIGTDVSGTVALPNSADGIRVDFNSSNMTIGGPTAGARNVISGIQGAGIDVTGGNGDLIQGNYVGTNAAGTAAVPNGGSGLIVNGTGSTVGGTAAGAGNLLSGNVGYGLYLHGGLHVAQGNRIGTDVTGTAAVPNTLAGVGLDQGGSDVVGGAAAGAGNLISGNGQYGIRVLAAGGCVIQGNLIGTDANGTLPLGNGGDGVIVMSGINNSIGGAAAGEGNIISGNAGNGINIMSSGNQVEGNHIGTDAASAASIGNGQYGVLVTWTNNIVGGTAPGAGNTIAFNGLAGVTVQGASAFGNRIQANSIHDNGGLGIDLGGDGVTPNTPSGHNSGPNRLQNFPVLTGAGAGTSTFVAGTLNSSAQTTFTIDFYASAAADPSGYGEGARYLGSTTVTTDSGGNASFDLALPAASQVGEVVAATATDPAGNTSEFSAAVQAAYEAVSIDIKPDDPANLIDLNSTGVLAVAVLTTPTFDATTVDTSDLSRILFGDVAGTARVSPVSETLGNLDGDSDLDRILVFSIPAIAQAGALTGSTTQAELTGFTFDGTPIRGVDTTAVIPFNHPPSVTTNTGLMVGRGGSATITQADLAATDPDNTPDQLTYTVTSGPAHGSLDKGSNPVTSFTQADLNAGLIGYTNDNSANETDSFDFTVSDGTLTTPSTTFHIAVDAVPVVTTNAGLTVARGNSAVIVHADLATTDADNTPAQLIYEVGSAPAHGTLRKDGIAITAFTQADIDAGLITYANDGTANEADSFQFAVSDGTFASGTALFTIHVDAVPAVTTNTGLTVNQSSSTIIAQGNLETTDADNTPAQLAYAVTTAPSHGSLVKGGNPVTSFTQADLNAGLVSYEQDGSRNTVDSFAFTVSDGQFTVGPATFSIVVNTDPLVTLQPGDVTAFAGTPVTFSAAANGSPTPTVRWQVSTNGGGNFTDIPGATAPTLTFKPTTTDNGSLYRAVFTNLAAAVPTNVATLTVTPGLVIVTNPGAQTVPVGTTATLTAAATGTPRPHVQWQVSQDGGLTFSNIPGAVHRKLRLTALAAMDGNLYRAVFSNSAGSAATTAATLTMDYHMTVAGRQELVTVPVGADVSLTGKVTGLPAPMIRWEASSDNGATYTLVPGAITPTLTFTVGAADNGRYFRAVFEEGHQVQRTAPVVLTVGYPPAVTNPPADVAVFHGEAATFSLGIAGTPVITVQWQVSTDGGKTFTNIRGAVTPTLTLTRVKAALNGNEYRAVLSNAFDQIDSPAATLTVS